MVEVIVGSSLPIFIVWGPERILLYNEAYREALGRKHPALGQDFLDVWSEFEVTSDRSSAALTRLGRLTGGVAHDFNNLLTPIVGALDMLQRKALGGEREQRLIVGAAQSSFENRTILAPGNNTIYNNANVGEAPTSLPAQ